MFLTDFNVLVACKAGIFLWTLVENCFRPPFWKQLKMDWGRGEGRRKEREFFCFSPSRALFLTRHPLPWNHFLVRPKPLSVSSPKQWQSTRRIIHRLPNQICLLCRLGAWNAHTQKSKLSLFTWCTIIMCIHKIGVLMLIHQNYNLLVCMYIHKKYTFLQTF